MPRGAKRKVGDRDEDQTGESSIAATSRAANPKTRNTHDKNRRLSKLEEYDEDPGRDGSRYYIKQGHALVL